MESDTHLRLLGEAAGRGQQLELCAAQVLARSLTITDCSARLLASTMGQGGTLAVLQALADRRESGTLAPSALGAWLKTAKLANQARNRVMHAPWVTAEGDGGVVSIVTRTSFRLEGRTEDDLRQDVRLLTAAVQAALELLEQ